MKFPPGTPKEVIEACAKVSAKHARKSRGTQNEKR